MMSIVRFPSDDAEMDAEEIDKVFDFIDERIADDAETRDVLMLNAGGGGEYEVNMEK